MVRRKAVFFVSTRQKSFSSQFIVALKHKCKNKGHPTRSWEGFGQLKYPCYPWQRSTIESFRESFVFSQPSTLEWLSRLRWVTDRWYHFEYKDNSGHYIVWLLCFLFAGRFLCAHQIEWWLRWVCWCEWMDAKDLLASLFKTSVLSMSIIYAHRV